MLGTAMHMAMIDLGLWIEPRLSTGGPEGRRIRPWLGMLIIALLVGGLVLAGEAGIWMIREATPHRDPQS